MDMSQTRGVGMVDLRIMLPERHRFSRLRDTSSAGNSSHLKGLMPKLSQEHQVL